MQLAIVNCTSALQYAHKTDRQYYCLAASRSCFGTMTGPTTAIMGWCPARVCMHHGLDWDLIAQPILCEAVRRSKEKQPFRCMHSLSSPHTTTSQPGSLGLSQQL